MAHVAYLSDQRVHALERIQHLAANQRDVALKAVEARTGLTDAALRGPAPSEPRRGHRPAAPGSARRPGPCSSSRWPGWDPSPDCSSARRTSAPSRPPGAAQGPALPGALRLPVGTGVHRDSRDYPNGALPARARCPLVGSPGESLAPARGGRFNAMSKASTRHRHPALHHRLLPLAGRPDLRSRPSAAASPPPPARATTAWAALSTCAGASRASAHRPPVDAPERPALRLVPPVVGRRGRVAARAVALGVRGLTRNASPAPDTPPHLSSNTHGRNCDLCAPGSRRHLSWSRPRRRGWATSATAKLLVLVRLGQLRLRDHHRDRHPRPYLTAVAKQAACPGLAEGASAPRTSTSWAFSIDPGPLDLYTATAATIISAMLLILPAPSPTGPSGRPGSSAFRLARLGRRHRPDVLPRRQQLALRRRADDHRLDRLGASLVVYDAILCRIASPDDRDKVVLPGWAFGYLGGGLLLALNLVVLITKPGIGAGTGPPCGSACPRPACGGPCSPCSPSRAVDLRGNVPSDLDAPEGRHRRRQPASSATPSPTCATTPRHHALPAGLPVLQRRHPDRHHLASIYGSEQLVRQSQLIQTILSCSSWPSAARCSSAGSPARIGAWRSVLRSPWGCGPVVVVLANFVPSGALPAVPGARGADRGSCSAAARLSRVLALQPAGAGPSRRRSSSASTRPWSVARLVRHDHLRVGAPADDSYRPAILALCVLRARLRAAAPRRRAPGHPRRRQRGPPGGLTPRCPNRGTPSHVPICEGSHTDPAHGRRAEHATRPLVGRARPGRGDLPIGTPQTPGESLGRP